MYLAESASARKADIEQARQDLVALGGSLVSTLASEVSGEDAALVPLVAVNLDLPPELRPLSLMVAGQRTALVQAQRELVETRRNALNWHDQELLEQAADTFEDALLSVLTSSQYEQLEDFRAVLAARFEAMIEAEVADG